MNASTAHIMKYLTGSAKTYANLTQAYVDKLTCTVENWWISSPNCFPNILFLKCVLTKKSKETGLQIL
ncbi:hypothetical protein SUGI_0915000 [Cryptomeria japonica]|nr:hypothetical protein SUGI_0915000 [Cryptomeria japonica]